MSIATEISRLQGLRNALRTKLVALGLAQSTAVLEDCVEAVGARRHLRPHPDQLRRPTGVSLRPWHRLPHR